jgi:hypothetical protein
MECGRSFLDASTNQRIDFKLAEVLEDSVLETSRRRQQPADLPFKISGLPAISPSAPTILHLIPFFQVEHRLLMLSRYRF